ARANNAFIALMVFDVERFGSVDKSLGRDGTDKLLSSIAKRLTEHFGNEAEVYRVAGDTFAIISEYVRADLTAWGDETIARMAKPFRISGREIFLAASAGIASGASGSDASDFLHLAELAMIQAKREGGGRSRIYTAALGEAASGETDPVA